MAKHSSRGTAPTSRVAYLVSRGTAGQQRARVRRALVKEVGGLNNYEIADTLGISVQSAGGRRNELMHAGKVCLTGEKRKTRNGGSSEVVVAREHASSVQVAKTKTYLRKLAQRRGIARLARDIRRECVDLFKTIKPKTPIQADIFRRLDAMTRAKQFEDSP